MLQRPSNFDAIITVQLENPKLAVMGAPMTVTVDPAYAMLGYNEAVLICNCVSRTENGFKIDTRTLHFVLENSSPSCNRT